MINARSMDFRSRDAERRRLEEQNHGMSNWRLWGPYLSDRQWGTVREDYSEGGDAWGYLPHEQARARAYRWGEDGLGGISDETQACACRWRCGTAATACSRSGCSA